MEISKNTVKRPPRRGNLRKAPGEFLPTSIQKSYFMLSDAERGVLNAALEQYRPGQSEPILVGGNNRLKPALRLMSDYRLVIEEIKDAEVITSYIRWVDAVQVRGAENQEVYLRFSPRFERIWLDSKKRLLDANSRLIKAVDAGEFVTSYRYDPTGNLVKVIDAKGNITRYEYDEVNNLSMVKDARGNVTHYTYDENNNRTGLDRPGLNNGNRRRTTYGFDELNRPFRITDPLGNSPTYTYDAAGDVIAVKDANGTTNTFEYDANDALVRIAEGDGSSVIYHYDAHGNRVSMEDSRGTTTYLYDALDQLVEVTHPDGNVVRYGYDKVGNRTSVTYPDGKMAVYDYDELNRLGHVNGLGGQTSYHYDAASNLRRIIYPNNTSIAYRYDKADRLVEVSNKRYKDILARFCYTLDELGNRTAMTASGLAVAERDVSYTYDELSQLIAEDERRAGKSVIRREYTYDASGNRLTQGRLWTSDDGETRPTEVIHYSYNDADRLLRAGDTTFTYAANGNRLTETTPGSGRIEYGYDASNHLIGVVQNERMIDYAYDGDGNKVEKALSAGRHTTKTLRFLNDVATSMPVVLHLAADRSALDVQGHADHHLVKIGPVTLIMAAFTD